MAEKLQKTPKDAESSGSKSAAEMLRERGVPAEKVPYGDSAKVRIPFPRKK
jgi:hypothetical protein